MAEVSGRADFALPEVTAGINGIAFMDVDGKVVYKPSPALTYDRFRKFSYLNALDTDMPYKDYWDIVRRKRIDVFNNAEFVVETARLYTTSHCPRRCGFCSSQSFVSASQDKASPIPMLPAEDVFALVLNSIDKYGARGFLFSDDDFPVGNEAGIERMFGFCELIIQAKNEGRMPREVKLFCQARVADFCQQTATGGRL